MYDRRAAVAYAARWWHSFNPAYPALADDCTNFASQVLRAGGLAPVPDRERNRGWWYQHRREGWSFSWAVCQALHNFLLAAGRAAALAEPRSLLPGDLILYDWDGGGRWHHAAVVVGAAGPGEPLVAAHTQPRWRHPWRLQDSPAYTAATRHGFLHIRSD